MKNTHTGLFNGGMGRSSDGLLGAVMTNGHLALAADDPLPLQTSTLFPVSAGLGEGNGFVFAANNEAEVRILSSHPNFGIGVSRKEKPKSRWCKVRAALTWGISVRRDIEAKRMGKPFFCSPQIWDYYVEE